MRPSVLIVASALAVALPAPALLFTIRGIGPAVGSVPPPMDDPSLLSEDWPMYGHDLWGTYFHSAETAVNNATVSSLVEKWRVDGIGMYGTPAVSLGTVYVSTMTGDVVALDATTGELKWNTSIGLPMTSSPAVGDGIVYVTDLGPNASLWALDTATGVLLWHSLIDTDAAGWGSPIVVGPLVIVGNSGGDAGVAPPPRGSVQAFDALTGALVWRTYTVAPDHLGGPVWTTPAVLDDLVFVGTGNSFDGIPDPGNTAIMAFSLVNGTVVWSTQFEDLGDEDFGASPTVFRTPDGLVLGEAQKNHYRALDAESGAELWSVPLPAVTYSGAVVSHGLVYMGTSTGLVVYGLPA